MFLEILTIVVIIGLIRGGNLSGLKKLDLKFVNLIFAAYLIQTGIDYWGTKHPWGGYPYLHIFSYFFLFFALYANRGLPGLKLFMVGTVLNFLPIVFNRGVMPVRSDVLPESVYTTFAAGLGGTHGLITESTRLKFLADILYIPLPYQNQLLSVGDLVIDAGIIVAILWALGKHPEV